MEYRVVMQGLTGKFANREASPEIPDDDVIVELCGFAKLPFLVLLPDSIDSDGLPVAIRQSDFMAELRFKKTVNENQNRHGAIMYMEDRRGELTYSEVSFRIMSCNFLDKPLKNEICDENGDFCPRYFTQFVLKFLRHFVLAYKEVLTPHKDWIEEITTEFCSPWKQLQAKNVSGNPLWQLEYYDNRGTGIMAGNDLTSEQMKLLQRGCIATEVDPTAKSFMQLANRARERGDWITHIVYLHTAFEYWIFREVRTFLFNIGKSPTEVESSLLKTPSSNQYISKEQALKLIFGDMSFKNTNAYTLYQSRVTDVRSSVIHVRATKLERAASEAAAQAFQDFSQLLAAKIKAAYSDHGVTHPKPLLFFTNPDASNIYDDNAYPQGR